MLTLAANKMSRIHVVRERREQEHALDIESLAPAHQDAFQLQLIKSSMEYDRDWLQKMHKGTSLRIMLFLFRLSAIKLTFESLDSTRQVLAGLHSNFLILCDCTAYGRGIFESTTLLVLYFASFGKCIVSWTTEGCVWRWLERLVSNLTSAHTACYLPIKGCESCGTNTDSSDTCLLRDFITSRINSYFEVPSCYVNCIIGNLLAPFCIQVVLHFCKFPSPIHQGVTLLTVGFLLSAHLGPAVSTFVWYRVFPLSLVTARCLCKTWNLSSACIARLQDSGMNMRKELEDAFISLDSNQHHIWLAHVYAVVGIRCAVGILPFALSPCLIIMIIIMTAAFVENLLSDGMGE